MLGEYHKLDAYQELLIRLVSDHISFTSMIRQAEIDSVLAYFEHGLRGKDLLEVGSGTGQQLGIFRDICRSVTGIELRDGQYPHGPEVIEYDGVTLPFADASFDVVFSSHVLEHLVNDKQIHAEMRRVLRPNGVSIHVVPIHGSRIYTLATHYPATARRLSQKFISKRNSGTEISSTINSASKRSLPAKIIDVVFLPRHGEYGNRFSEVFLMRPSAWRKRLRNLGWEIANYRKIDLAYSGYGLFGTSLTIPGRRRIAAILSPSTMMIELIPRTTGSE